MKMGTFEKSFVNAPAHSRRVAAAAVRRLRHVPLRPGWSYLDVGCGNGVAALHVAETLGLRVVGVDVDPSQIALARELAGARHDVSFTTASATDLPFDAGRFDIVATNKLLHHVPDWRRALTELQRVVGPGGYLVFADLLVPSVLAPSIRGLLRPLAGVLTRLDLERAFSKLHPVHQVAGWFHYEGVLAKR
jgi:ubiquinone/menaquinone biosynthesis C-methylase UbiE